MSKSTDTDTGMCQRCNIKEYSNHLYNLKDNQIYHHFVIF